MSKHSEETKRKISQALMGRKAHNKGKPMSEEQKQKLRKPKFFNNPQKAEENRKRISLLHKGRKNSPEIITKMKLAKQYLIGKPAWNRGLTHSEESKRKMSEHSAKNKPWLGKHLSESHRKKISEIGKLNQHYKHFPNTKGENNPAWKGGVTKKEGYSSWKNHRRRIRKQNAEGAYSLGEWELLKKQYGFTCPSCKRKEPDIKLTLDHIIPLIKGGSNYIENIQPLCLSCNCKKSSKIIKYEY